MHKLVLIRHGQSHWNKANRFTGWKDIDLSEQGREEAKRAAKLLKDEGFVFDEAYTSVLKRAIRTLWIILDEMDLMWIPVTKSWLLNERHYGALQGLNKAEMAAQHGEEQVQIWRRSFDVLPPLMDETHAEWLGNHPSYALIEKGKFPKAEALKNTIERVVPYYETEIATKIKAGKRLLIAAHGNSLRALVKYLDEMSDEDIVHYNIPTGVPLVYELGEDLKPTASRYLGDQEAIKAAQEAVANQGKTK